MTIRVTLPLPPSKNVRRTMINVRGKRIPVVSSTVKAYRKTIAYTLGQHKGRLPDNTKIVFECNWRKSNANQDICNMHDELMDAVCPALGLNDKWALIRDGDFIVDKENAGVDVCMYALEAVK